jgi:hypothetical protein
MGLASELVAEQGCAPPKAWLFIRFAQFIVGAWALDDALGDGDLSACGDWIGWALSETIEPNYEVTIEVNRLNEFWASRTVSSWPRFRPTLVCYLGAFYYYARLRVAMRDVALAFWDVATELLDALMTQPRHQIHPQEAFLGSCMLAWAAIEAPGFARELTVKMEAWVEDPAIPVNVRSVYCLSLATGAGQFSDRPQSAWARRTLDEFGAHLDGEQRVQMLASAFNASDDGDVNAILTAIEEHQSEQCRSLSPLAFAIQAGLRADVILPFIERCLLAGRTDTALLGISRWYQAPTGNDALDSRSVLLLVPFSGSGYVGACHRSVQRVERESQALLERLTRETNAFLGTALTVARADNSALRIPERPGVPDVDGGSDWFSALREAYCPVKPLNEQRPESQLMLLTAAHPLQAVQLEAWGVTWPIAASLASPHCDRRPSVVALWSGGGSLTEAMELEMVCFAFKAAGASVETFGPNAGTRDDFLAAYQDPKYDILWVASHGEFDHWSPRRVKLQIAANGASVFLEDLLGRAPRQTGRRLLVLNVCDGARFEETGMVPRLGLAAGLAVPQQATVSHLWPVLGFPSAAFGVYLAHYLAAGASFFDAYVASLAAMRKQSSAIADELHVLYKRNFELLDRLRARDEDYAPLQFSGSAAFFQ